MATKKSLTHLDDDNRREIVRFLVEKEVIRFGSFITKSGRESPYYFNVGAITSGDSIVRLGQLYASYLAPRITAPQRTIIFGPAYKGIPIAVAAVSSLATDYALSVRFSSNRKEKKHHGDVSLFLGATPTDTDLVIIVEDVITAGSTLKEVLPLITDTGAQVVEMVVLIDRQERGDGSSDNRENRSNRSALDEISERMNLVITPILSLAQILDSITTDSELKSLISPDVKDKIADYQSLYGVSL